MSVDEKGKISLSIKQTLPKPEAAPRAPKTENREPREREFRPRQHDGHARSAHDGNRRNSFERKSGGMSFEDKMSRFLKDSEERLTDLKRNTESKRGGRGGRRD